MTNAGFIVILIWTFMLTIATSHPVADKDAKCEYPDIGYLSVNKTISLPGQCMSIMCNDDLTISGLTCPTYFMFPGCRLTEIDFSKKYPDCCPEFFCHVSRFAFSYSGYD